MSEEFNQQLVGNMRRMRVHALALTRNSADADDLVQITALLALRHQAQFMPGTNFAAWTGRILKNRFISNCRGAKRIPMCIDDVPESLLVSPQNIHVQVLAGEAVKAMGKLSPVLREALSLACEEHSCEELAAALSCSVGTVKSRVWRARRKMRELLPLGEAAAAPFPAGRPSTWKTPVPPQRRQFHPRAGTATVLN